MASVWVVSKSIEKKRCMKANMTEEEMEEACDDLFMVPPVRFTATKGNKLEELL